MERVVGGGPDGEDGLVDGGGRCALLKCIRCAHVVVMCGWSHQEPGQQKSAFLQERRLSKPGEIFVRRISPSAHRANRFAQPP